MAYRPTLIKPPVHQNPRALLEARMQRQALVKALADRLGLLVAAFQGQPARPASLGLPASRMGSTAARPPARPVLPQPPRAAPWLEYRPRPFVPPPDFAAPPAGWQPPPAGWQQARPAEWQVPPGRINEGYY